MTTNLTPRQHQIKAELRVLDDREARIRRARLRLKAEWEAIRDGLVAKEEETER